MAVEYWSARLQASPNAHGPPPVVDDDVEDGNPGHLRTVLVDISAVVKPTPKLMAKITQHTPAHERRRQSVTLQLMDAAASPHRTPAPSRALSQAVSPREALERASPVMAKTTPRANDPIRPYSRHLVVPILAPVPPPSDTADVEGIDPLSNRQDTAHVETPTPEGDGSVSPTPSPPAVQIISTLQRHVKSRDRTTAKDTVEGGPSALVPAHPVGTFGGAAMNAPPSTALDRFGARFPPRSANSAGVNRQHSVASGHGNNKTSDVDGAGTDVAEASVRDQLFRSMAAEKSLADALESTVGALPDILAASVKHEGSGRAGRGASRKRSAIPSSAPLGAALVEQDRKPWHRKPRRRTSPRGHFFDDFRHAATHTSLSVTAQQLMTGSAPPSRDGGVGLRGGRGWSLPLAPFASSPSGDPDESKAGTVALTPMAQQLEAVLHRNALLPAPTTSATPAVSRVVRHVTTPGKESSGRLATEAAPVSRGRVSPSPPAGVSERMAALQAARHRATYSHVQQAMASPRAKGSGLDGQGAAALRAAEAKYIKPMRIPGGARSLAPRYAVKVTGNPKDDVALRVVEEARRSRGGGVSPPMG